MSSSISNYILLTCAHCRRSLRIRSDYRGRRVICNHCDHAFLAEESGTEPDAASRAGRDQAEAEAELRAARAEAQELRARLEDQRRLNERLEARYQAACIEHARENEESFRLWEIERQELTSTWRQVLRNAQEQAAQERDRLHTAALDREQHLHAQKLEELQLIQAVLESVRVEREQLALELETAGQDRLLVDPAPDAEDASLLRHELARLQENLDRLQQQRDEAIEQAAALRLERDRLHDSAALLEARLQDAAGHDRRAFERLEQESAEIRGALAAANQREAALVARVESLQSQIDHKRADHNDPAAEQQEKLAQVGGNDHASLPTETDVNDPGIAAPAAGSEPPTTTADGASPLAPPIVDETPADLPPGGLPRPVPLPEESPEARMHRLRRSLCAADAASSGSPFAPSAGFWEGAKERASAAS